MRRFQYYMSAIGRGLKPRTCGGTKETGIQSHTRGWNVGARVIIDHQDGKDVVRVYATKGTNGDQAGERDSLVCTIIEGERPIVRAGE